MTLFPLHPTPEGLDFTLGSLHGQERESGVCFLWTSDFERCQAVQLVPTPSFCHTSCV